MGIKVEFDPDLALRDYEEFIKGNRKEEECIPEKLVNIVAGDVSIPNPCPAEPIIPLFGISKLFGLLVS